MTRRLAALAGLLGAAAGLHLAPAAAAPVVAIRARTDVVLEPIRREEGGIIVRGIVRERGSGAPVPYAEVNVILDGQPAGFTADEDGRFAAFFPTERGRQHRLAVQFEGNRQYDPAGLEIARLDVSKRPLTMTVSAPGEHQRAGGPLSIRVFTQDELSPASVPVTIHVGPQDRAGTGAAPHVIEARTGEDGSAAVAIPPEVLGGPGPVRIEARFGGSDVFDEARSHATVLVRSATTLALSLESGSIRFEGRVRGRGQLLDDRGTGISGATVALVVEDERGPRSLDEALTGEDGRFELEAGASELGTGAHRVQAVFDPIERWLDPSRSEVARLVVEEKRPVPVGYSLAAFAATAASILVFVGLRTRPWRRWMERLRAGSPGGGPGAATEARGDAPPRTGLAPARPGLVSTLRRAHDHGFSGVVADAMTGRPLAGAAVVVRPTGEGERAIQTDAAGRFELEDLPAGTLAAEVACPGYVTERFPLPVPHRGELREARVDLLPVRERIFTMYREAAEPLLPRPELWGVWTPRQIVDHVRELRPAGALSALTDYVEEKYFSIRVPGEEEIPLAEERVRAARREVPPVDPRGPSEYSPG